MGLAPGSPGRPLLPAPAGLSGRKSRGLPLSLICRLWFAQGTLSLPHPEAGTSLPRCLPVGGARIVPLSAGSVQPVPPRRGDLSVSGNLAVAVRPECLLIVQFSWRPAPRSLGRPQLCCPVRDGGRGPEQAPVPHAVPQGTLAHSCQRPPHSELYF